MRRTLACLVSAVALTAPASPARADIPEATGPGAELGAAAIDVLGVEQLGPRLEELTLATPAVDGPTSVRVLLPPAYRSSPERRFPVLYLLHGAFDDHTAYTEKTDVVEELTERLAVIVVMPDTGSTSGYQDWFNGGDYGPPAWETYHVAQLIPWIDRRYRTVPTRKGRAVAGLSMGGYGAIGYAARHPDLFAHAAGFSPAVDATHPGIQLVNQMPLITGGLEPSPAAGTFANEEMRWRANNPVDLAENLRGPVVSLRTGDGRPGGEFGGIPDVVERVCFESAMRLHDQLDELGIEHTWDYYGPGAHTWPYWERDLRLELPRVMETFRDPPSRPRQFSHRSGRDAYDVWRWQVEIRREALEFSRLAVAGPRRFSLAGSGRAVVATPPSFGPGERYRVEVSGAHGRRSAPVVAGGGGRLRINVPLGPANAAQQYTDAAEAAGGTAVYTTRVVIRDA